MTSLPPGSAEFGTVTRRASAARPPSDRVHVIHPTGNEFVRALLLALQRSGARYHFYTTLGFAAGRFAGRAFLPSALRRELQRRSYPIPASCISSRPLRELCRIVATRLSLRPLTKHETGAWSVDAIYRDLDRHVASDVRAWDDVSEREVIYGYEDGCVESFASARQRGVRCVYDLPIAYWKTVRRLLTDEAERLPAWEPTLLGTRDSSEKCDRKSRELESADAVICPSRFVYDSLPETTRAQKECVIAPFGSPLPIVRTAGGNDKLRVLFAGTMTQRKGLADVFTAFKILKRSDVELVVIGSPVASMRFYREQYAHFRFEPTRSHEGVMELMRTCDVLLLPSIVEGRALVQQEALSCGLPIIVTPNAGGADLIEEGVTGFLVPIRSPEIIAEKIGWIADNRSELGSMQRAAMRKAAEYSWESYGEKLLGAL